jgi:integrase
MRSPRKPRAIDRMLPGVGRLTIRTKKLTQEARDELDRYITRALQAGHVEQLRLLKDRSVSPLEFLVAARTNKLLALKPAALLRPLVEEWLASADLRESSRQRYRQSWNFLFADAPSEATPMTLDNEWWGTFAKGRQVSNATLNRDRAALLVFLNWAKQRGHAIPGDLRKKYREEPHKSGILTLQQVDAVRRHCRADRWPFFWALLDTGARHGEMLNLRGDEVPLDLDLIVIRSRPGSKSRGKERHVPISPELATCLRTLAVVNGGGRLFPYGRTTVRDWWNAICRACSIRGVTLHGLRATFITRALDAGVSVVDTQKLVGHSEITQTMKYNRNSEQSQTAAARIRLAVGISHSAAESVPVPALVPAPALD